MTVKKSPPSAGTRRVSYHHGDLKRALTSAALSLVAERGPKGFTLTEAARRAGVSAAAPYRHFADKAHLIATVAEQGFLELHLALSAAADAATEPRAQLIGIARAYVCWAIAHPDHYRVMFGADTDKAEHPSLAAAAGQAFDDLLDAITRCQDAGMMRGQMPQQIAAPLWSLVHGIASLAIDGELRNVGIHQDPGDMVAYALSDLLRVGWTALAHVNPHAHQPASCLVSEGAVWRMRETAKPSANGQGGLYRERMVVEQGSWAKGNLEPQKQVRELLPVLSVSVIERSQYVGFEGRSTVVVGRTDDTDNWLILTFKIEDKIWVKIPLVFNSDIDVKIETHISVINVGTFYVHSIGSIL
jgi:AcrR family transcriptional regulator